MAFRARPYQLKAIRGVWSALKNHASTLVVSPTGSGKCLAPGTQVMKFDGTSVAVEQIVPGDLLMGPDSKPRTVLSICTGEDEMYEIIPRDGSASYSVNSAHILSLRMTNQKLPPGHRWHHDAVVNISVKEYLQTSRTFKHCAKGWRTGVEFPESAVDLDPYFLGLWLGDGHSYSQTIFSKDVEVEQFLQGMAKTYGLRFSKLDKPSMSCPALAVVGVKKKANPIRDALRELNVIQNKHVPHAYKANSRRIRLEVLAGLLDSDGSLTRNGNFDFISSLKVLAEDVVWLARSIGLRASVQAATKTCQTGASGTYYRVCISGDIDVIPTKIVRKQAFARRQKKNPLRYGFQVKHLGRGRYHGFTLDGDRLFLLSDFTVTHNTVLFSMLAEQWDGPVLVLAHRKELLQQAKRKLQAQCREPVGIDQGQERAAPWGSRLLGCERIICGSVQTLVKASRRRHYDPAMPWLVIVDEAHHATATSYRSVLAHFSGNPLSKVVGVTATPKRTDKQGLISAFESAAYVYPIREAIDDGWLVDVEMLQPKVTGLDFSKVGLAKGDLDAGQIADIATQERPLHEVAAVIKREVGQRQGIVFCANRKHVESMTAVLQRDAYFGESRVAGADGETDPIVREQYIARFESGDLQILVNCGLFIEGLDVPAASWLAMCRPTKSEVIFTQALGRIMRPLGGLVDVEGWGPDDRKGAIAGSAKPQGLLLDFCGIAGRHKLVDLVDVLHSDRPPEVREAVRKVMREAQQPLSFDEAAHRAAAEEQLLRDHLEWRKRQAVAAEATYEVHSLGTIGNNDGRSAGSKQKGKGATGDRVVAPGDKPTDKMVRYLRYLGVSMDDILTFSKKQAGAVINSLKKRQGVTK